MGGSCSGGSTRTSALVFTAHTVDVERAAADQRFQQVRHRVVAAIVLEHDHAIKVRRPVLPERDFTICFCNRCQLLPSSGSQLARRSAFVTRSAGVGTANRSRYVIRRQRRLSGRFDETEPSVARPRNLSGRCSHQADLPTRPQCSDTAQQPNQDSRALSSTKSTNARSLYALGNR